jgi:hypothetical protein
MNPEAVRTGWVGWEWEGEGRMSARKGRALPGGVKAACFVMWVVWMIVG